MADVLNGEVSDMDKYIRKALAGSVVGFLSGAMAWVVWRSGNIQIKEEFETNIYVEINTDTKSNVDLRTAVM